MIEVTLLRGATYPYGLIYLMDRVYVYITSGIHQVSMDVIWDVIGSHIHEYHHDAYALKSNLTGCASPSTNADTHPQEDAPRWAHPGPRGPTLAILRRC